VRLYSFGGVQIMATTSPRSKKTSAAGTLNIEDMRLVSDLRIMHLKVDELHHVVENLKRRHSEADVVRYADYDALADNIRKVDETYLWFVKVKEERDGSRLGT
jgi:hypothetical protein